MSKTRKKVARRPARKTTALVRSKKRPAPRPSTAIAVRPKIEVLERDRVVNEGFNIGELGLVELKLTDIERKALAEPINVRDIEVKPTGQAYLPHPVYTRRLNEIFGVGRWMLVPVSKPILGPGSAPGVQTVVCDYVLYIHGQPAAHAKGEQEYHESNKDQTYGDALEATYASGLRRCCKRLGIALELWTRDYLDDFVSQHCVRVPCNTAKRGQAQSIRWQWRRRSASRFWNEIDPRDIRDDRSEQQHAQRRSEPERDRQSWSDGTDGQKISQPQAARLDRIIHNSGRGWEHEVLPWLQRRFSIASKTDIKRGDYEWICKCIEGTGTLPEKGQ
jgi:hypothetical protein